MTRFYTPIGPSDFVEPEWKMEPDWSKDECDLDPEEPLGKHYKGRYFFETNELWSMLERIMYEENIDAITVRANQDKVFIEW